MWSEEKCKWGKIANIDVSDSDLRVKVSIKDREDGERWKKERTKSIKKDIISIEE